MKNLKYILVFSFLIAFYSCNKENSNETSASTDSLNQVTKDSTALISNDLQTFEIPEELQGCSCYFAKNQEDFKNGKYIYADDYGNTAYIKIDNKIVKIPMEEGDFDPSDFNKTISNDDYTITIKGKKVKEFGETTTFEGKLILKKKDGSTSITTIYGECGC
jgi:hypothetical protein